MTPRQVMAFASLTIVIFALPMVAINSPSLLRPRSYADVPPSCSESLRGVVEPITMVCGYYYHDGGSAALGFEDSKGRRFSVCLMNDLSGDQQLRFGSIIPRKGRAVPIGGLEERAFLGLLERWARGSRDAREWMKKLQEWRNTDRSTSLFSTNETDQQRGNAFALGIMESLSHRN